MDLFAYYRPSCVWICKLCQYAVCPQQLNTHLRLHHHTHPTAATDALRQDAYHKMSKQPWLDPAREPCVFPDPESPPVPNLPIYPGYRCSQCRYIVRSRKVLYGHIRKAHPELRRPRGGQSTTTRQLDHLYRGHPVSCQRFFPAAAGSSFFAVTLPAQVERAQQATTLTPAEFIRAQVDEALEQDGEDEQAQMQQIPLRKHATEVSPWLELTRWPEYLGTCNLVAAAALGALPDPSP